MTYSKSEVGHALNTANLEKLMLTCQLLGANYNPTARQLQTANLSQLLTDGKNAIDEVANQLNIYKNVVNSRQDAFAKIKPLGTQIISALISGGASLQTVKDAKAINAKLQGRGKSVSRAKIENLDNSNSNGGTNDPNGGTNNSNGGTNNLNGGTNDPNDGTNDPNGGTKNLNNGTNNSNGGTNNLNGGTNNSNGGTNKTISTIQQSYAQIVGHLSQLVNFIQQTASYNPNEVELQVPTLLRFISVLQAENSAVVQAEINLANARILRNELLYNPQTGIVATAMLVKTYCKSVLSTQSPLYKEVNKIRFSGKK